MSKPRNKEANIRAYYGEVNKFSQNGEYDKAIKSLNKSELPYTLRISGRLIESHLQF